MPKKKEFDIQQKRHEVSQKHVELYDKLLENVDFALNEYSKELSRADIEFLEMPKGAIATLEFLISAVGKIQKGQCLALGLDENKYEDTTPVINIIEGLCEAKL